MMPSHTVDDAALDRLDFEPACQSVHQNETPPPARWLLRFVCGCTAIICDDCAEHWRALRERCRLTSQAFRCPETGVVHVVTIERMFTLTPLGKA